jgi:hypothetical protein
MRDKLTVPRTGGEPHWFSGRGATAKAPERPVVQARRAWLKASRSKKQLVPMPSSLFGSGRADTIACKPTCQDAVLREVERGELAGPHELELQDNNKNKLILTCTCLAARALDQQ